MFAFKSKTKDPGTLGAEILDAMRSRVQREHAEEIVGCAKVAAGHASGARISHREDTAAIETFARYSVDDVQAADLIAAMIAWQRDENRPGLLKAWKSHPILAWFVDQQARLAADGQAHQATIDRRAAEQAAIEKRVEQKRTEDKRIAALKLEAAEAECREQLAKRMAQTVGTN